MKNIKNITDFLLDYRSSIKEAFIRINYLGEKYGPDLMFIVAIDEAGYLKGTLTDGDVRRGIISGLTLDSKLDKFINSKPVKGKYKNLKYNKMLKQKVNEDITFIPLVNNKNEVIEILLLEQKQENIDVLLLAGGFGKRLGKLTSQKPKPLIKIGNRSIIDYVMDRIENIDNINNLYVSLHYYPEKIIKHLNNRKNNLNIEYLIEKKPLGTIGSVSMIRSELNDLLVINADIYSKLNLSNLIKFHRNNKYDATIAVASYEHHIPFGVIEYDKNQNFIGINEKPKLKYFISAGMYVLSPIFYSLINDQESIDMPDLIHEGKKLGFKIGLFPIHESWSDIGNIEDLNKQNSLIKENTLIKAKSKKS